MTKSRARKSDPIAFVQQSSLQKLKCTKCRKYLSKFPIHRSSNGDIICGRCPLSADNQFFRDELYENAVEFQIFPCVNRELGCLEILLPSETDAHEKVCPYKKYKCLTAAYNNCTWEGYLDTLVEHFNTNHPAFVLKDGIFEIDFVNTHCENYLMHFGGDFYVVTRECSSRKDFSILVQYIELRSDIDQHVYEVTLENGNKSHKYSVEKSIGTKVELQVDFLRQKLQDPVTIVATILIRPASKQIQINNQMNKTSEQDLRHVECPVCFVYMIPPIFQCVSGHSICESCMNHQKACPQCLARYEKTRNYALESVVLGMMIYPCSHKGCTVRTEAKNIREHEATCSFGPGACPLKEFEDCSDIFPASELLNHIRERHYESLLELDTVSMPFDSAMEEDFAEGHILQYKKLLFKICFLYQAVDKKFFWSIQYIGSAEDCSKFNYELEILDINAKGKRLYFKSGCNALMTKDETFQAENNYVYLNYDQISQFIKYQLTYRISISDNI